MVSRCDFICVSFSNEWGNIGIMWWPMLLVNYFQRDAHLDQFHRSRLPLIAYTLINLHMYLLIHFMFPYHRNGEEKKKHPIKSYSTLRNHMQYSRNSLNHLCVHACIWSRLQKIKLTNKKLSVQKKQLTLTWIIYQIMNQFYHFFFLES